jgi:hypothetical protein
MIETTADERERKRGNGNAAHAARRTRSELEGLDEEIRGFVREQPLLALGLAGAAGYLVGRMFSRL